MKQFEQPLDEILKRIDALLANPDPDKERALLQDLRLLNGDIRAELMAQNPSPGWQALEAKIGDIAH